jgi:hypothetical protein
MNATRDTILQARNARLEPMESPEFGGTVYVRAMSGTERDAFEDETYKVNGKSVELNRRNGRARLLVRCLCDAEGKRLFTDADAQALGEQPAYLLDPLYAKALRLNGFTASDVEELAKNSETGPSAGSGSN